VLGPNAEKADQARGRFLAAALTLEKGMEPLLLLQGEAVEVELSSRVP
jgi:hypothetical protein